MSRTASNKIADLGLWIADLKMQVPILIFFIFIAFSCSNKAPQKESLPYYNTPDFTPYFINDTNEVNSKITHTIADFSFTDQDGKKITNESVKGKIHVADFFFTSCGSICPKMTAQLKRVQSAFENDDKLVLLSYSVTPWLDSVSRLKKYAEHKEIDSKHWHLLTGKRSEIYSLARRSYFAEEQTGFSKDSSEFLHTEHFILVDQKGRIRGVYNGTLPLEAERLISDIKELENDYSLIP